MRLVEGLSIFDPGSNSPRLILFTDATHVKKYEVAYFIAYCKDDIFRNQTQAI